jgi:hypothetical protein
MKVDQRCQGFPHGIRTRVVSPFFDEVVNGLRQFGVNPRHKLSHLVILKPMQCDMQCTILELIIGQ